MVQNDQENENPEFEHLKNENINQQSEDCEIVSESDSSFVLRLDDKCCSSKSVVTPNKISSIKRPNLKRSSENEIIPRHTIPLKKAKTSEVLTEKISSCFDTFNKVMEKNITEQQSTQINDDEHFVRSLVADMSIFSQKDKIILKKNIYQVISAHLESTESDSM